MKLKVFKRENKKAEVYRREGKIPGVLYGVDVEATNIYAEKKIFLDFYKKYESGLFDLELKIKF